MSSSRYDFEPANECVEIKDKCIRSYFLLGRKGEISVAGKAATSNNLQANLRQFIANGTNPIGPPFAVQHQPDSFSSLDVQSVEEVPIPKLGTDEVEVLDPVAHANEKQVEEGNAGMVPAIGDAIVLSVRPRLAGSSDGPDTPGSKASNHHANSLHEIVTARARSPIPSSRARSPLMSERLGTNNSRSAILAGSGGYGESRPVSPLANMPLRHHGSAARMEDGANTTDSGMADTSYSPPSLGMPTLFIIVPISD